jgi:hypothetical protein
LHRALDDAAEGAHAIEDVARPLARDDAARVVRGEAERRHHLVRFRIGIRVRVWVRIRIGVRVRVRIGVRVRVRCGTSRGRASSSP